MTVSKLIVDAECGVREFLAKSIDFESLEEQLRQLPPAS